MSKPNVTVRFRYENPGWSFEVDAADDPVKPWASGTAPSFVQAWDTAANYAVLSGEDAEAEARGSRAGGE